MIKGQQKTELGVIKINNEVIAAIASLAACEVKGVHKMAVGIAGSLHDLIRKCSYTRGVKIVSLTENDLKLNLSIIVEYGVNIPEVAVLVQENVRISLEKMLGISPSEVNVRVQGVHMTKGIEKEKKGEDFL